MARRVVRSRARVRCDCSKGKKAKPTDCFRSNRPVTIRSARNAIANKKFMRLYETCEDGVIVGIRIAGKLTHLVARSVDIEGSFRAFTVATKEFLAELECTKKKTVYPFTWALSYCARTLTSPPVVIGHLGLADFLGFDLTSK